jgi:hypothetical protein
VLNVATTGADTSLAGRPLTDVADPADHDRTANAAPAYGRTSALLLAGSPLAGTTTPAGVLLRNALGARAETRTRPSTSLPPWQ